MEYLNLNIIHPDKVWNHDIVNVGIYIKKKGMCVHG